MSRIERPPTEKPKQEEGKQQFEDARFSRDFTPERRTEFRDLNEKATAFVRNPGQPRSPEEREALIKDLLKPENEALLFEALSTQHHRSDAAETLAGLAALSADYDNGRRKPERLEAVQRLTEHFNAAVYRTLPNIRATLDLPATQKDEAWTESLLVMAYSLAKSGNEQQKQEVLALARDFKELLKRRNEKQRDHVRAPDMDDLLFMVSDPKERQEMIAEMKRNGTSDTNMLFSLCFSTLPEARETGRQILEEHLTALGLPDTEKMLALWTASTGAPRNWPWRLALTLRSALELEEKAPRSAKELYEEFGIAFFERYPKNLLLRQLKERERLDMPYGIAILAREDHSGTLFSSYQELETLSKRIRGLTTPRGIRIFEADSARDVAKILLRLDKKYGSSKKIEFALIEAHADPDRIVFGSGEGQSLSVDDLTGKGSGRVSEFFTDHPTFLLNACSAGAKEGIGQKLSERIGARVLGPEVPILRRTLLKVSQKADGSLNFKAEWDHAKPTTMAYSRGTLEK
jgi:hypothetical protein